MGRRHQRNSFIRKLILSIHLEKSVSLHYCDVKIKRDILLILNFSGPCMHHFKAIACSYVLAKCTCDAVTMILSEIRRNTKYCHILTSDFILND